MIDAGWDEYRGWAARARKLQADLRRWNMASLLCAVAAAIFGGLAVQLKDVNPWGSGLALAAAVAAAITPLVGREILSSGVEKKWIGARALAESIKSQCYRVAAGLPPWDGPDAGIRFMDWRADATGGAAQKGIVPLDDPVPPEKGDKRRPGPGMDEAWYLEHRVRDQRAYFATARDRNERAAGRLRWLNIAASLAAAGFAAAGAARYPVTAWAGVFVTISAAIVAVGLLERRHTLAAQYGAMAIAMGRIEEWREATKAGLAALVDRTEALLTAEHAAWAQSMAQTGGEAKPAATGAKPPAGAGAGAGPPKG
jgi:hypothetical protein